MSKSTGCESGKRENVLGERASVLLSAHTPLGRLDSPTCAAAVWHLWESCAHLHLSWY